MRIAPVKWRSPVGIAFTIDHIAAVAIPAAFGLTWLVSPAAVSAIGAAMAAVSLGLARRVPAAPAPGREVEARRAPMARPMT